MNEATARTLAQAIIGDITDRRGFRQVWADTDADQRQEVVDDLVKVVLQYAPKEPAKAPELTDSEVRRRSREALLKAAEKGGATPEQVDAARILLETVGR